MVSQYGFFYRRARFFQHVFTSETDKTIANEHNLTVETSIPKNVADILGNAKLTLLAQISHINYGSL